MQLVEECAVLADSSASHVPLTGEKTRRSLAAKPRSVKLLCQFAPFEGRAVALRTFGVYNPRGTRSALPLGAHVYGDFCTGEIFQLVPATSGGTQTVLLHTGLNISSFGEDEAGEIYVVGLGGTVDRLTTSPPPPPCLYSVSPTGESFTASGGSGNLSASSASSETAICCHTR